MRAPCTPNDPGDESSSQDTKSPNPWIERILRFVRDGLADQVLREIKDAICSQSQSRDASQDDDEVDVIRIPQQPEMRQWTCTTNCSVIGPIPPCGFHISGVGIGSVRDAACSTAKANANSKLTRPQFNSGCRIKHCTPCNCTRQ